MLQNIRYIIYVTVKSRFNILHDTKQQETKKNEEKSANNAGLSNNSSSQLRKKQRIDNADNNSDNLVSYF
jgi:hypothetical protein